MKILSRSRTHEHSRPQLARVRWSPGGTERGFPCGMLEAPGRTSEGIVDFPPDHWVWADSEHVNLGADDVIMLSLLVYVIRSYPNPV